MYILASLLLAVLFGLLYRTSLLLMQLVLVQSVETVRARWCFASILAFSIILLFTVIMNTAMNSSSAVQMLLTTVCGATAYDFILLTFTFSLTMLLSMLLLVCPLVLLQLTIQGLFFSHGKNGGDGGGRSRARGSAVVRLRRAVLLCIGVLVLLVVLVRSTTLGSVQRTVRGAAKRSEALWQTPREVLHHTPAAAGGNSSSIDGSARAQQQQHGWQPMPAEGGVLLRWLALLTAKLAIVGVSLMGLLAGYASVMSPFSYVASFFYWRGKTERLQQARVALTRKQRYVLGLYGKTQRRIAQNHYDARRQQQEGGAAGDDHASAAAAAAPAPRRGVVGWARRLGGVLSSAGGKAVSVLRGRRAADMAQLQSEAEATRFLQVSLCLQGSELEQMLEEAARGDTWVGKLYAVWGVLLGCYTALKLVLTIYSLAFFQMSAEDPVSHAVSMLENALLVRRRGMDAAAAGAPQTLTAVEVSTHVILFFAVIVNAWLVLSSIRGLLLLFFQLTLSFSSTVVTADTTAIGFAVLCAFYFLGQLLMLRQSLPDPSLAAVGDGGGRLTAAAPHALFVVLGHLPLYYYQRLYEWCYLVGCGATVVVRRLLWNDPATAAMSSAMG